ncbi:hypothetical protein AD942_01680 [Gluconobacter japonicus]|uniref:hypothetical protein n=1 Tax=Gluconobacter japonicus TaxID=376620 RepID=UPI0007982A4A|nr:hypothetical protein [Gluconobacter japonicus]KXV23552.1 hypothetical protein AD936_22430 [Gluconobacter japonicus]KXV41618.1 hypothetical protein AD942_01680 [Gluconobacter japonicus]
MGKFARKRYSGEFKSRVALEASRRCRSWCQSTACTRLCHDVERKRVRGLMATMGMRTIYQKPHTTNRIMRIAIIRSGITASERNTMLNLWANKWG